MVLELQRGRCIGDSVYSCESLLLALSRCCRDYYTALKRTLPSDIVREMEFPWRELESECSGCSFGAVGIVYAEVDVCRLCCEYSADERIPSERSY